MYVLFTYKIVFISHCFPRTLLHIRAIKVQQMLNLVSQNVCIKTFAYLFGTSCTSDSTIVPNTLFPQFFRDRSDSLYRGALQKQNPFARLYLLTGPNKLFLFTMGWGGEATRKAFLLFSLFKSTYIPVVCSLVVPKCTYIYLVWFQSIYFL
jgi:hypothetical protein